jgi:hypothetical protein
MLALQNEGSHGHPIGACDVRHTARKLVTDQIITTDTETRSRTECCNYDVMCNRARYTKCATNSGGQRSFDWASILFHYPTTWFYSVYDTPQGTAVAWPNAQEKLHFRVFSQTWRRANPEVNSSRDGTLSRTDSTCDAVCMPDAAVA